MDYAIGRADFCLRAQMRSREHRVSVCLVIRGEERRSHLELLRQDREAIESALGGALQWSRFPKSYQLLLTNPKRANFYDPADWRWQHEWLAETLGKFDAELRRRVLVSMRLGQGRDRWGRPARPA